jgi:hypothetical protein
MKYYTVGAYCVIATQKMLKDMDSHAVFFEELRYYIIR